MGSVNSNEKIESIFIKIGAPSTHFVALFLLNFKALLMAFVVFCNRSLTLFLF